MIEFTDSHCHLQLMDLPLEDGSIEREVKLAKASDVNYLLCVATHIEQHEFLVKICELNHHTQVKIHISVGLHPNESSSQEPDTEVYLKLAKHPNVVAIGETGLDYYRDANQRLQHTRFITQIETAKRCKKPLIIHSRQAKEDTIKLLKAHQANQVGGVFHCFAEDWAMAKAGMDMGFFISFSGIVTFKNAQNLHELAKQVPLDNMLIETDSPYLAPVPYRGKPNRPAYVVNVAKQIAQLKGIDVDRVASQTTQNYKQLFGII